MLIPIRPDARAVQLRARARADDRGGLRGARQADLADGAGGPGRRPGAHRRGRPPLPRDRHRRARARRTRCRSGARSGPASAAYFYRYGRGQDLGRMVSEHRELLAALQSRDPERDAAPCSSSTSPCRALLPPRRARTAASARPATSGRQPPRRAGHERPARGREPPHVLPHARRRDPRRRRRRLLHREGRDARRRRRVGERQVGDRALDHAARRPARPGRAGLVDHVRGPRPREAPRGRDGEDPGQRDLDDLPGADDVAQPRVHGGRPDRRVRAPPPGRRQEGGGRRGRSR